ncbi:MAG: hypothetical protein ACJA0P_000612 [Planctomycetota bacterium]|jgi:hypothetical protein
MAPWDPETGGLSPEDAERFSHAIEKRKVVGKAIDAHCVKASTGEVLWTRRIDGSVPSIYSYPFSDATSASPVADGAHVWFTNAGGTTVCFSHAGEEIWRRAFDPTIEGPFNKQFEPFLVRDGDVPVLVSMEPFAAPADTSKQRWHHLVGLDARTGKLLWKSDDALTHYNAPTLVEREEGPTLLIGRGGPHAVPERPVGMSMVALTGDQAGKSVWRFDDPRAATVQGHEAALQSMAHDDLYAYWILMNPANVLVVLDLATGKEVKTISLTDGVTRTSYEPATDDSPARLVTQQGVTLEKGVMPARYTLIATGAQGGKGPLEGRAKFSGGATSGGVSSETRRYVLFQCYALAWGKPTIGPLYSFARVQPESGLVEYVEVPTDVSGAGQPDEAFLWREPRTSLALNSRGVEVTGDARSHWDGWDWVFNGTPTRVNRRVYFTLASGVVYAFDAFAAHFDARALLAVNDLGPAGETWSANSLSYAHGRLYHRTAAELICIGDE